MSRSLQQPPLAFAVAYGSLQQAGKDSCGISLPILIVVLSDCASSCSTAAPCMLHAHLVSTLLAWSILAGGTWKLPASWSHRGLTTLSQRQAAGTSRAAALGGSREPGTLLFTMTEDSPAEFVLGVPGSLACPAGWKKRPSVARPPASQQLNRLSSTARSARPTGLNPLQQ